jgi:hypothetical protein
MAFSNISNLSLGEVLRIAFTDGFNRQMNISYPDWEVVQMMKVSESNPRELRYLITKGLGPAAVAFRSPGQPGDFAPAQSSEIAEATSYAKEMATTLEFDLNLFERAKKSPEKYGDYVASEVDNKLIVSKRKAASLLYGDGTGVIGQALSVVDTAGANGYVTVTLKTPASAIPGTIGNFQYQDLLICKQNDGSARAATVVGTFYAWQVISKVRKTNIVVLAPVDSSGTRLNLTASNIADTDVFYPVTQITIPDRTAVADWGTASEALVGLESLAAASGRTVNGIALLEGVTGGTHVDASGATIDTDLIHELFDELDLRIGSGVMNYKKLVGAPEVIRELISNGETSRQFVAVEDMKRGARKFIYQHLDKSIEVVSSEFVPKDKMYALPESKGGDKVLEYHGTDFYPVEIGGQDKFLAHSGTSFSRKFNQFMQSYGNLICKHPGAIGCLKNFVL